MLMLKVAHTGLNHNELYFLPLYRASRPTFLNYCRALAYGIIVPCLKSIQIDTIIRKQLSLTD